MRAAMSELAAEKKSLRNLVKQNLKCVPADDVLERSSKIVERLGDLRAWKSAKAVSCFISMPSGEVQTAGVLELVKTDGKKLFVPKVLGAKSADMVMLAVGSPGEIDRYPKSKWGIPESPEDGPDATYDGTIDLVVVPGVVFDVSCHRIGHGKGYYDCFLSRINEHNAKSNLPRPVTIGLCLDEQLHAEAVPIEAHDVPLDYLVTPTTTYSALPLS